MPERSRCEAGGVVSVVRPLGPAASDRRDLPCGHGPFPVDRVVEEPVHLVDEGSIAFHRAGAATTKGPEVEVVGLAVEIFQRPGRDCFGGGGSLECAIDVETQLIRSAVPLERQVVIRPVRNRRRAGDELAIFFSRTAGIRVADPALGLASVDIQRKSRVGEARGAAQPALVVAQQCLGIDRVGGAHPAGERERPAGVQVGTVGNVDRLLVFRERERLPGGGGCESHAPQQGSVVPVERIGRVALSLPETDDLRPDRRQRLGTGGVEPEDENRDRQDQDSAAHRRPFPVSR